MKEVDYHSDFHKLVCTTVSDEKVKLLPNLIGCSPHRRTSIFKRPKIARHDEVLFFSRLLKKPVLVLMNEYGLGTQGVTQREKDLHRHIDQQAKEPALSE